MLRVLPAASCLLLAGCWGDWRRPEKAPGSALWIAPGARLEPAAAAGLARAGIGELFVEAGVVEWSGEEPRVRATRLADLPRRSAVTLVVSGPWRAGDPALAAARLGEAARRLRVDAESRGFLPVGVHLDLDAAGALATYGDALGRLRAELGRDTLLSASLARGWAADPDAAAVADGVDLLVPFLYGQRPGEAEDDRAWSLAGVEEELRRVEGLGRDYLLGVVTLGGATHLDARGERVGATTALELEALVGHPALRLQRGFSLSGLDRQAYSFESLGRTRLGPWQLERGDVVRVVRNHTANLQALERRLGALDLARHLGQLYYRLPGPGEGLAMGVGNLVAARAAAPPAPDLALAVEPLESRSDRLLVRLVVENRGDEPSDLAFLDHNYVTVTAVGGIFGEIASGDFRRYELRDSRDPEGRRALRQPDTLRLYLPLLGGRRRAASGPLEVRRRGDELRLVLTARFLLPDGRVLDLPAAEWRPGDAAPTGR